MPSKGSKGQRGGGKEGGISNKNEAMVCRGKDSKKKPLHARLSEKVAQLML